MVNFFRELYAAFQHTDKSLFEMSFSTMSNHHFFFW